MMQSNQPYGRVDDGIGAGLVGGAVIGGATTAAYQFGGKSVANFTASTADKLSASMAQKQLPFSQGNIPGKVSQSFANLANTGKDLSNALHTKSFVGSGKKKAVTYGASVLAGSLLGGIGDAMNK